jgi:hypothetical protein
VPVLPSLANPSDASLGGAGWFGALFKSLDSRRAGIRDKVEQHVKRLQQVATAEMRDAEPKLHAAIADALAGELASSLDRQRAWIDDAIAAEREAFAREREAQKLRAGRIAAARIAVKQLSEQMTALGAKDPRAAAASRAFASQ